METISVSLEFLAGVLKTPVEQLTSRLKDGETFHDQQRCETELSGIFTDYVSSERRKVKDDQYSRGRKEALTAKEREIKQKYENLNGSTIDDIIDELMSRSVSLNDIKPEDIRQHPVFKEAVNTLNEKLEQTKGEYEKAQSEYRTKESKRKLRRQASELLKKNNFVTPDEVADSDLWLDILVDRLSTGDNRVELRDGELVVLDKDGGVAYDDKTVKEITFEEHFTQTASKLFKKAQADPNRKSPENKKPEVKPTEGFVLPAIPATETEYLSELGKIEGSQNKRAYMEAWDSRNGG